MTPPQRVGNRRCPCETRPKAAAPGTLDQAGRCKLRPKASGGAAGGQPTAIPSSVQDRLRKVAYASSPLGPAPSAWEAKPVGRMHANLPGLPLHRQRGHNALPRQPHQFRLFNGVDTNLSGELENFCKKRQENEKGRKLGMWKGEKKS